MYEGSLYLCSPRDIVCVHKIFIQTCAITSPQRTILALLLHLAPAVIVWGKTSLVHEISPP